MVELLGCHWRERRVDNHPLLTSLLDEPLSFQTVTLFLNMMEVFSVVPGLAQTVFKRMQDDIVLCNASGNLSFRRVGEYYLRDVAECLSDGSRSKEGISFIIVSKVGMTTVDEIQGALDQFEGRLLAHAISDCISAAINKDAWAEAVLPIIVVREAMK